MLLRILRGLSNNQPHLKKIIMWMMSLQYPAWSYDHEEKGVQYDPQQRIIPPVSWEENSFW
jgi:hypothetical protein